MDNFSEALPYILLGGSVGTVLGAFIEFYTGIVTRTALKIRNSPHMMRFVELTNRYI